MNLQDEYYFIIMQAISRPEQSNRKFFFNKELKKIFSLANEGGWKPHYRSEHVKPSREKVAFFEKMIAALHTNDSSIVELQPIPIREKVEFLSSFVGKYVQDEVLKKSLTSEIASFGDSRELKFLTEFRNTHWEVFASFDRERVLFLLDKIAENYPFFDLENVLEVVW